MDAVKPVTESKTIGLWLLLVIGFIAEVSGIDVDVTDGVTLAEIIQVVSAVLLPFARYVATHRLSIGGKVWQE